MAWTLSRQRRARADDLDRAVLAFNRLGDGITWRDLMTSCVVLGDTGSGKSSILRVLAAAAMRGGASLVCFAVKPGDAAGYADLARRCGRTDVEVFRPLETPFNPLRNAQRRWHGTLGQHEKLVELVMDPVRQLHQGSSGDAPFWSALAEDRAAHVLTLALLSGTPLSFRWVFECVRALPRSPREAADPAWQRSSPACVALSAALERELTTSQRADLDRAGTWLLSDACRTPEKTAASIEASLNGPLSQLVRGEIGDVLNHPDASWSPCGVVDRPGVLVLDCSTQVYGPLGRVMQRLIKRELLDALRTRDLTRASHPVLLVQDEMQELIDPKGDPEAMRTLRDRWAAVVGATQCVSNVVMACGEARDPHAVAAALLGLAGIKVFCSSTDPETLRFAEQAMTSTPQVSATLGKSERGGRGEPGRAGGTDRSTSLAIEMRPDVPGYQIARLRRGGPANGMVVEAFVTAGGRVFRGSRTTSIKVAFRQI
ncbi:MAG: hypothetical protein RBS39_06505 [Phycisphaerales bacterium]|jgi:energy-coupling factor transporter ATP-binding protein EcfA2|nr:hypothetical protein [Phycisphaerales bacterium]